MQKYVAGEPVTAAEIQAALRQATLSPAGGAGPVRSVLQEQGGAAAAGRGGGLPAVSAGPRRRWRGRTPRSEREERREATESAPFSALVFKIMADPFVGQLAYFRVYSGTLDSGSYVLQLHARDQGASGPSPPHARQQAGRDQAGRGGGHLPRPWGCETPRRATRSAWRTNRSFWKPSSSPSRSSPSRSSRRPRTARSGSSMALATLANEDPTFRATTDEEMGQTIISGMGELAPGDYRGPPAARVPRGGQRRQAAGGLPGDDHDARLGRGRFIRQTGGRGQYGHVKIQIEPAARRRFRVREQDRRGDDPEGVHPGRGEGDPGGDGGAASWLGIRWSMSA